MRTCRSYLLPVAAVVVATMGLSSATEYYVRVKGSDTQCNGKADVDYSAAAAPNCALATPQGCFPAGGRLAAGDNCNVHSGTYFRACNNDGGMTPAGLIIRDVPGTASNPVTLRGYPGDAKPIICSNDASCPHNSCTSMFVQALSGWGAVNYLVVQGLKFNGGLEVGNSEAPVDKINNVRVTANEFVGGAGECDGNQSMIRVINTNYTLIDHNFLHDPVDESGTNGCTFNWMNGTDTYGDYYTTWEYNTWTNGAGHFAGNQGGVFNMKACPMGMTVRYNYIGEGFSYINQIGDTAQCRHAGEYGGPMQPSNMHFYGNIVHAGNDNFDFLTGSDGSAGARVLTGWQIYNNTFVNAEVRIKKADGGSPRTDISDLLVRDNAFIVGSNTYNIAIGECLFAHKGAWTVDNNGYTSGKTMSLCYYGDEGDGCGCSSTNYTTMAAWRSATTFDAASTMYSSGCTLVTANPTNYLSDYHLAAGPCTTASSLGGKLGWEGVTSCVGYQCPSGVNTAPATPTNVRRGDTR